MLALASKLDRLPKTVSSAITRVKLYENIIVKTENVID